MPRLELDVIRDADGAVVLALPSSERLEASMAELRARADLEEESLSEALLARARAVESADKETRAALDGMLERVAFPYVRYSYGQLIAAQREATSWRGDTPTLDQARMDVLLLAAFLQRPTDELEALDVALVAQLIAEMRAIMSPSPLALRFFASRRPNLEEAARSEV